MLAAVTELFAGDRSVDRLEAKRAEAVAAVEPARTRYREACLAAEANEADAGLNRRRINAGKDLTDAEQRVRELDAAIEAARDKAATAAKQAAEAEVARLWAVALGHADARREAAQAVQEAIASLRMAFDQLVRESAAVNAAAPARLGSDGAITMPPDLENVMRLELVRAGFRWAGSWPWGLVILPSLGDRIAAANAYIRKMAGGVA